MKVCSPSLVTKKMHIKITFNYHSWELSHDNIKLREGHEEIDTHTGMVNKCKQV